MKQRPPKLFSLYRYPLQKLFYVCQCIKKCIFIPSAGCLFLTTIKTGLSFSEKCLEVHWLANASFFFAVCYRFVVLQFSVINKAACSTVQIMLAIGQELIAGSTVCFLGWWDCLC